MTRAKEITKEAKKFAKEIDDWEIAEDVQDAFEQGAEWADQHPDIDVRTMAAWSGGYKEAIEKACEWLSAELDKEEERHYIHVHGFDKERREIFLEDFRKAMKGGDQ